MEQTGEQVRYAPDRGAAIAPKAVTVVCLSDTHDLQTQYRIRVPDGDILIHAGDLTNVRRFAGI